MEASKTKARSRRSAKRCLPGDQSLQKLNFEEVREEVFTADLVPGLRAGDGQGSLFSWVVCIYESGAKSDLHPTDDRGQKTGDSRNNRL
jgi:hypothetical protein